MGWIVPEDMMPPNCLRVLVEVSGCCNEIGVYADHSLHIGQWIISEDEKEGEWFIDSSNEISFPTVHAWMPLSKHFAPREMFAQSPDMMEHSMLDDEPEWLYKGDAVYEQMSLEDWLNEISDKQ